MLRCTGEDPTGREGDTCRLGVPDGVGGGSAGMEGTRGKREGTQQAGEGHPQGLGPPHRSVMEPLPSQCVSPPRFLPCPHLSPSELVCFGLCVPAAPPPRSHLLLPH